MTRKTRMLNLQGFALGFAAGGDLHCCSVAPHRQSVARFRGLRQPLRLPVPDKTILTPHVAQASHPDFR